VVGGWIVVVVVVKYSCGRPWRGGWAGGSRKYSRCA